MDWLNNLQEIDVDDIQEGDTLAFKMFAGYTIVDTIGEIRDDVVYNEKDQKIGRFSNIHKAYIFSLIGDVEVKTMVDVAQLAIDLGREGVAEDILDELLESGLV